MKYRPAWTKDAQAKYDELQDKAAKSLEKRTSGDRHKKKPADVEGLFAQVQKAIELLLSNPKHSSLKTHEYDGIENPYDPKRKVFEAYAQNRTPGAYRVFWCYGPERSEITIIAITPHP